MKNGKVESDNRGLVAFLCVLVVVIVGLIIGIVVVTINASNGEIAEEQTSEDQISYNEYVEYGDTYRNIDAEVKEMLKKNSVDMEAINKLYAEQITKNIESGQLDRASSYIYAQRDNLVENGFLQEALETSLAIDYSIFDGAEQYRQYSAIVEIAKELGRAEVVAEYEPKLEETKAAYESSYYGSEAAAEAMENFKIPEEGEE